jgi:hypothetical protein
MSEIGFGPGRRERAKTCAEIRGRSCEVANISTVLEEAAMPEYDDFQEIAHCGGRVTFHVICDEQGRKAYSMRIEHNRPTPAAWVGVYARNRCRARS